MYESLTDKLLFDYYMIDSRRKDSIFSPAPFYLEKKIAQSMKGSAEILDILVQRIVANINASFSDFIDFIPDFNYKRDILNLKVPLSPVFWVRFDGFIREDGGIFFSEFNYDKPCAQREILASEYLYAENNINKGFKERFINSYKSIASQFFKEKRTFNTAILIDPCHLEESRLSYLYTELLEDSNFHFIAVGPKNLKVVNDELLAFGKEKIDIILRQFPTEHLDEVTDIETILKLYNKEKILILNDPRIIIGQCKNLFSFLWNLVSNNDDRLTNIEKEVIRKTIPYTVPFKKEYINEVIDNKDKYVLKPVYGRYSEDVFIGILYSREEWLEVINYVLEKGNSFILQEFCPIHKDSVTAASKHRHIPKEAFGNFGVYLIDGKVKGFCTRWNESYLTCDESTWITPIGLAENPLKVVKPNLQRRKEVWDGVTDRAMMESGFTGRYFRDKEYIGLDSLLIDKNKFLELKNASEALCHIFKKTQKLVIDNIDTFSPVLGISSLDNLAVQSYTDSLVFLGRMDWCLNSRGQWKLLEFNSETPAGLVESIGISKIIKEELNIKYENPNEDMEDLLKNQFHKIIKDYEKVKKINNIAILSSTYYEDWYNTSAIYNLVKSLPYNITMGNIFDVKVHDNKMYLYGEPIDAVFRYYPLDWFLKDGSEQILKALEFNTLSINPPHTIITQSKAFLALIFELKSQGFFSEEEANLIDKYITQTSFDVESLNTVDICLKPLLDREGNGVLLGCNVFEEPEYDFVFQEREDIRPLDYVSYCTTGEDKKLLYPIIGTYIAGDKFCGVYTRLGELITTNSCIYTPIFLKQDLNSDKNSFTPSEF